jgi:hypothetical protein
MFIFKFSFKEEMQLKLLVIFLVLMLGLSIAMGRSPIGGKGGHHQLKLRKRMPYNSDGGPFGMNGNGGTKHGKMPPRKMIEKPRLRFKGRNLHI